MNNNSGKLPLQVISVIGTITTLIYFILCTSSQSQGKFIQLAIVFFLLLANLGATFVTFVDKNTKDTYLIPFALMIIVSLLYAYNYLNSFVTNMSKGPESTWWYASSLGQVFFACYSILSLLLAYLAITGVFKKRITALVMLTGVFGGFLYDFIVHLPQKLYSYFGDVTSTSMKMGLKQMLMSLFTYTSFIFVLLVLICLLGKVIVESMNKGNE